MDRFAREALRASSPARRPGRRSTSARRIRRLRDRYGRNGLGPVARCSPGGWSRPASTFVTVHFGGWDHHWDLKAGMENYLPQVDAAVAALFEDLTDRGLLDTTLVVLCGEFSRTPKMNDGGNGGPRMSKGTPGRDHWGNAMFCLLGGGGVKGGQVVGSTDRLGTGPEDAGGDPVEHPRHHLPGAGHRPEAPPARPDRPADPGARRPGADRRIALARPPRAADPQGHRKSRFAVGGPNRRGAESTLPADDRQADRRVGAL